GDKKKKKEVAAELSELEAR
ncbi:hypothetical protein BC937DRAFT_93137, partial [Endogone sp. FLAS-F59071]